MNDNNIVHLVQPQMGLHYNIKPPQPDPPEWMGKQPWNREPDFVDLHRQRRKDPRWIYFWVGVLCGMLVYFIADKAFAQTYCDLPQNMADQRCYKPSSPRENIQRAGDLFVADGDSFTRGGMQYRLWGIDAPELNQTCDGKPVGRWARKRLQELLGDGSAVNCQHKGKDRYGRTLAICVNHEMNVVINQVMVQEGLALPYLRYTNEYAADAGWGPVVQYHCTNPEQWRHK